MPPCTMDKVGTTTVVVPETATVPPSAQDHPRTISLTQLSSKNTLEECWIAYEGIVYDVTHWLSKHPGGMRAIMAAAGQDASSVMKSLHTPDTLKVYMKRIRKVGVLALEIEEEEEEGPTETVSADTRKRKQAVQRRNAIHKDFDELNEKLIRDGWYKAQPWQYTLPVLRSACLLLGGISLVLTSKGCESLFSLGVLPPLVLGSMMIGFFFQQVAFMGHDAGHGSITSDFSIDNYVGFLVGNFLTGIDIGWWKATHYVHHSATNSLHDDPDIQHMPLLCFDTRIEGLWSKYHGKYMPLDAIGRLLVPYQHLYFYPVMAVARINLYIQSILYLIKTCPLIPTSSKKGRSVLDESTGQVKEHYAWPKPSMAFWSGQVFSLIGFYAAWFALLSSLDSWKVRLLVFAVSHFTAGLLHVQILISHVAMDYCMEGSGATGTTKDPKQLGSSGYYEWQALSTMDVACPPYMDWFHGGLQFQLEHHLFPRVPRWRLRALMPLVDDIFRKHDIPTTRVPFFQANKMIVNHMADIGAVVAQRVKPKLL